MTWTRRTGRWRRPLIAAASVVVIVVAGLNLRHFFNETARAEDNLRQTRGRLMKRDPRIRKQGDRTFVWAGPREHPPGDAKAQWFDFTGAPFPPNELQFGIGMDSIRAIDDPLFVRPDDPRLLKYIGRSPYRRDEVARTNDEIRVIGIVRGHTARAYPIALLDRHEVVNDRIEGKPVAVGW